MKTQVKNFDAVVENLEIVRWKPKFATGIKIIDAQHRELVGLTNELYQACLVRDESIRTMFKDAMSRMVEYVRFHFSAENELLEQIEFPDILIHKKDHETLIMNILAAAKSYEEGNRLAPNTFVRILKDWIFGHIAVSDMYYSGFVAEQKKRGLLADLEFEQIKSGE